MRQRVYLLVTPLDSPLKKIKEKDEKIADWFSGESRVVQKLRDVRHEDIPEINKPKIIFPVLEGDKLMKEFFETNP